MQRATIHFNGHVQGVGFRFTVLQLAHKFPVNGFVRNLRDGRVEVVIEGNQSDARAFVDHIKERMNGYIDHTEESTGPATGEFRAFEIRR
jgi:acylphosphatase